MVSTYGRDLEPKLYCGGREVLREGERGLDRGVRGNGPVKKSLRSVASEAVIKRGRLLE